MRYVVNQTTRIDFLIYFIIFAIWMKFGYQLKTMRLIAK